MSQIWQTLSLEEGRTAMTIKASYPGEQLEDEPLSIDITIVYPVLKTDYSVNRKLEDHPW